MRVVQTWTKTGVASRDEETLPNLDRVEVRIKYRGANQLVVIGLAAIELNEVRSFPLY